MTGRLGWLARGEPSLPVDRSWLAAGEAARAAGMAFTKRRTEYLLRRWAVKHAVAVAAGLPADTSGLARIEVRNAPTGAPQVWVDGRPMQVGVSVTDRAGWAVCLVSDRPSQVGCDLELVERRSAGFLQDFLTEAERAAVAAAGPEAERQVIANLIWSAKESALKVLQTGLRRDTWSVEVHLAEPTASAPAWTGLVVRAQEGRDLPGWWCRYGSFLLTVAYDAPAPPPVSLEEPAALAAARPVHSWLARPI